MSYTTEHSGALPVADTTCVARECAGGQAAFLRLLFRLLDEHAVRYCVLHSWEELPDRLPSDLDVAVHPEDRGKIADAIGGLRAAGYRPIQCFHYSVGAFYFVFAWRSDEGMIFACLDILLEHWRCGHLVSDAKEITDSRRRRDAFWTADEPSEVSYLLAKRAWKGMASATQAQRIKVLVETLGPTRAEALAGDIFFRPLSQRILAVCLDGDLPSVLGTVRWDPWLSAFARHPIGFTSFVARDFYRRAHRWIKPTGLLIAVLGTDGTGKSTLVEGLRLRFAPAFRWVARFHWAPRLIVPRKNAAPNTHPHAKAARSALLSSCILLTVVADYWIGYLISLRPSRARSGLILFDRYFHDVLIDPQRYRYGGPLWLARWMARLIPSPDMVVILDADERVIGKRKAELPAEETRRQRQKYKELRFPRATRLVINTEKGEELMMEGVSAAIVEHLARRFESRNPEWLPVKRAQ